jgi:hypothetical protein
VDLVCRVRRIEGKQRHGALAACMEPAKPCERCHVEVAGALWAASPGLELVMIGWINLSVEAFIRDSFGDDAWAATVAKVHERPEEHTLRSRNCTQLRHAALARHECEQRLCTVRKWDRCWWVVQAAVGRSCPALRTLAAPPAHVRAPGALLGHTRVSRDMCG